MTRYEELISKGYKLHDTGYAENKAEYEKVKLFWANRTDADYKVYRAKSDTKGLMAYEVYKKEV